MKFGRFYFDATEEKDQKLLEDQKKQKKQLDSLFLKNYVMPDIFTSYFYGTTY